MLLERAQAGRRLARVEDRGAGALDGVDVAARERGDAGEASPRKLSATRSPVRTARSGPATLATAVGAVDARALLDEGLEVQVAIERAEDGLGDLEPADDAGLLHEELRGAARVRVDRRVGRDVARADVLGERRGGELRQGVDRYGHVSSTGSAPRRRTTWPSRASSSAGKSERKCAPRLSSRVRAHSAVRRASRCGASRSRSSPAASRMRPQSRQSAERSSGVTGSSGDGPRRLGQAGRERGLAERGECRAAAEDETLEQRVGRKPVRAVNAGRCALSGGVETRKLGAPVEVGDDAADRVVRRGRHRDGRLRRVVALLLEPAHEPGEAVAVDLAQVEQRRAARVDLARHDVARRELVGEAMPVLVEQERALSAQRLGEEERGVDERGRVELRELEVGDGGAGSVSRRYPVAHRARRVRRARPERGCAAGREQRRASGERPRGR